MSEKKIEEVEVTPYNKKLKLLVNIEIVLFSLIIIVISVFILSKLKAILIPFIMGALIAYVLYPVPKLLQKIKIPRWLSISVIYVIFVGLLSVFILFQIPTIMEQIQQILTNIPSYVSKINNYPEILNKYLSRFGVNLDIVPYTGYISQNIEKLSQASLEFLGSSLTSLITNTLSILFTIILSIYMLADADKIINFFKNVIFKGHKTWDKVSITLDDILRGYFKGMILLSLIVGGMAWVSCSFLGVKYSIIIALIVGLFDLVPFVGPIIAVIIAGLIVLYQSPFLTLIVIIVLTLIQYIENQFFRPVIQGDVIGVHPLVIFLSILLGAKLWGIIGIFLAMPFAGLIYKTVFNEDDEPQKNKTSYNQKDIKYTNNQNFELDS